LKTHLDEAFVDTILNSEHERFFVNAERFASTLNILAGPELAVLS
jgi:hypothetical protein